MNVFGACLHLGDKHLHLEASSFSELSTFEEELLLHHFFLVVIATHWSPELRVNSDALVFPEDYSIFNYEIMMLLQITFLTI